MDESDMRVDQRVRRSMRDLVREALVTGLAVVVPLIITAIVLAWALQFVHSYLSLVSENLTITGKEQIVPLLGQEVKLSALVVEVLTPVVLILVIFVVGLVVSTTTFGERAVDYFDSFISRIPAIGGVYDSFRQMSDVVLESDVRNFRDVKLVEFPHDGAYTLGFVTTETPEQLAGPTRHPNMLTLFLPLAPNPVMGGHLVHMPRDKVIDVDMTVEEGIRAVVTSGVAVADKGGGGESSLSEEALQNLASTDVVNAKGAETEAAAATTPDADRESAYRRDAEDPSSAPTPDDIAGRNRDGSNADWADGADAESGPTGQTRDRSATTGGAGTPAEAASRRPGESESTGTPPAERTRDPEARDSTEGPPDESTPEESREATGSPPDETTRETVEEAGKADTDAEFGPRESRDEEAGR